MRSGFSLNIYGVYIYIYVRFGNVLIDSEEENRKSLRTKYNCHSYSSSRNTPLPLTSTSTLLMLKKIYMVTFLSRVFGWCAAGGDETKLAAVRICGWRRRIPGRLYGYHPEFP